MVERSCEPYIGERMGFDLQIIRASFAKLKPLGSQFTHKFYEFLLLDEPYLQEIFKTINMESQANNLWRSLVFIVENLDNRPRLEIYLQQLGQRHSKYGVKEEHFECFGKTLLKTFAFFHQQEWSEVLQKNWMQAYESVTTLFKERMDFGMEKLALEKRTGSLEQQVESFRKKSNLLKDMQSLPDEILAVIQNAAKIEVKQRILLAFDNSVVNEVERLKSNSQFIVSMIKSGKLQS